MKKLILFFATITFTFFTAQAQYDILLKQGVYDNVGNTATSGSDYAYGAANTYDHQYDRKNDRLYNYADYRVTNAPQDRAYTDNRPYNSQANYDYNNRDNRNTNNKMASIVIKKFEVERFWRDEVELELCVKGPSMITTSTQWQGTTLFVYLDYPYSRNEQYRTNKFEVHLGRLSKDIRYNVIVLDANNKIQLGQYAIN